MNVIHLPWDAKTFVKGLQSITLKTAFSVWKDSQLADCSCEFHYMYPPVIQHYSGVRNAGNFIIECAKLPSAHAGSPVCSGSGSLNDWISHVLGQVVRYLSCLSLYINLCFSLL